MGQQLKPARESPRDARQSPWVLIAGGFHPRGGMDRANAALARYLGDREAQLYLVAHQVDSD